MSIDAIGFVVDASVGVKLFLRETDSDRAEALFALLAAEPAVRFHVPDLFFVECANILWKYVRRSGYPAVNAAQDMADLTRLKLRSVSTADLVRDALPIAINHGLTAYDACYIALGYRLGLPLVTADEAMVQAMLGSGYAVQRLADYAPLKAQTPPPPSPA